MIGAHRKFFRTDGNITIRPLKLVANFNSIDFNLPWCVFVACFSSAIFAGRNWSQLVANLIYVLRCCWAAMLSECFGGEGGLRPSLLTSSIN